MRWTKRIGLGILLLLLLATFAARVRSYLMTREIEAVLRGLAQLRIDQTTEEQIKQMFPHLAYREWQSAGIVRRVYYSHVSNEDDHLSRVFLSDDLRSAFSRFGYRYLSFDAGIAVEQGKVVGVTYGVANRWIRPQVAGYVGYLVSARSVHGFWYEHQYPFHISSQADFSPEYRPFRFGSDLSVIYTADAPSTITERIFKLNLSCFWGLRECHDAQQIAPSMWDDVDSINRRTYEQLISGKCPDSIIEGRLKYLPEVTVLLVKVTGSRRIPVNEEGSRIEDWFTDYELQEVMRGHYFPTSFKNIRRQSEIASVLDPTRMMANQIWPETKVGAQVLYFSYPGFQSCRFIPATPSAVQLVRRAPFPPKRREDEVPSGLQ